MRYWLLGAGVAFLVVFVAVWLPNWRFLWHLTSSVDFTPNQKVGLLATTLDSFRTNFSPLAVVVVTAIAIETGVYISLLVFWWQRRAEVFSLPGVGFWGTISGLLGIGCASCGSIILTGLLGLATTTAFLGWLPFRGQEFGFLAIGLLGFATISLYKKIRADSCKITS